ncbi:MAG: hypothetical protein K8R24_01255, partial [Mycobacterium sp.]|nr:hypothetical protein [Mycobacterium sp.]
APQGRGMPVTTALIVGGLLLVGVGLVASQLFRLRDWLNRQPPAAPPDEPGPPPADDEDD